jgi:hypothetical protein
MFQVEQKSDKGSENKKQAESGISPSLLNPAEMLREQNNAMQRNAGLGNTQSAPAQMMGSTSAKATADEGGKVQAKAAPVQMQEEEEELMQAKKQPAQMMVKEEEEEKPVQGKGITTQMMAEEEEEIQTKADPTQSKNSAERSSPSSMSFAQMNMSLQAKMQNSFGTSFQNVNIHQNDNSATQMGALAYTQGNNVHFAPGQFNPNTQGGQELLGHELTHVVQQRQGRVQPTKQGKGMSVNDNPSLESEADNMGRKAANGQQVDVAGIGSGVQKIEPENEIPVNDIAAVEENNVDNDGQNEQLNNTCVIENNAGTITISLYDNAGNSHEKELNLTQVRDNKIIKNLNWNAIVHILEFCATEIDDFNYTVPTNLSGTNNDNSIIIPDDGVIAILQLQANHLIEQNNSDVTNNNFQNILNGIDGWPGNTFASFMGEESINDIRDEGNNTSMVNADNEAIEVPDFDSDSEETLYDFMRDITLARNGLWSDNDNIVNLTGLRRELEISEEEDHEVQWNDTMAASWIETDEEGNEIKHCKHYTATTEPGNRDENRMIAPQTLIMRIGLHIGRQPAGRLKNTLIIGSDDNNNTYDFDNNNLAGMNIHPGGIINNQRGGMGLTNHILDGFPGQLGAESDDDVQDILYLSEIFKILSKYGKDRDDSAYDYLKAIRDEAIELQQQGNNITDVQQDAINDFDRIDTIFGEDVFTEARKNYIKNTVEFDVENEDNIYAGNTNGYNVNDLDDDATEISGVNDGARVAASSEGCQVIFGGKSFYDFWWNTVNKAENSNQLRWYYTLVDITTPYNSLVTEEGEINE